MRIREGSDYDEIKRILTYIFIVLLVMALTQMVSCSMVVGSMLYKAFPSEEVKKILTDRTQEEPRIPSAKVINR